MRPPRSPSRRVSEHSAARDPERVAPAVRRDGAAAACRVGGAPLDRRQASLQRHTLASMRQNIRHKEHIALRRRLDGVTHGVPDAAQLPLIARLADEYPHSIRLVLAADEGRRETWAFNCHTFTFGLRDSEDVLRHVTRKVFPNAAYVERLLAHVLIDTDEPVDADFVIYFDGDTIQHSGIWVGGRVHSKWGTGHLWEHALHEVPFRYGAEVRFFHSVPPEQCIAEFVAFARGE